MKREEDEMQKKGKPREVRGNVGGDGKEERRWRERRRKERGGEPSGGSQGKDQRGQDGRLREEGRVEGDAERLEILS